MADNAGGNNDGRRRQLAGKNPADGCTLEIETFDGDATQFLVYHLSDRAHDLGTAVGVSFDPADWPLPLAEYDQASRTLKTFPTWLRAGERIYALPKYRKIRSISFDDHDPIVAHDGFNLIFDLPTGFLKSPFEGFGLLPPLKYIVEAFEQVTDVDAILIASKDREISIEGTTVRLPLDIYDEVRLSINRAHEAAREFANGEKREYLRSRLLPPIVPGISDEPHLRTNDDLREIIHDAIHRRGTPRSRQTSRAAAVRTVMHSIDEIAEDDPVQLFALSKKIELTSLQVLIDKMTSAMAESHLEAYWQAFFRENPFILKMLFGLPAFSCSEQASVGGMGLERSGEKYADFLLKAGALGNLGLVEIKRPGTPLLTNEPYREPTLYGPSAELSGGVNQLLEQRLNLTKSIALKKESENRPDIQAWYVPCILVIGTSPTEIGRQRSFELFRGNQREVLIITFDELLAKLQLLHAILVTESRGDLVKISA